MTTITTRLSGTLRGRIWMPDAVCIKDISLNLSDLRSRYSDGPVGTFRHVMCTVVNDGDFRSASLTRDSELIVESTCWKNGVMVRRTKFIPITRFKSVRDLLVGYRSPAQRQAAQRHQNPVTGGNRLLG